MKHWDRLELATRNKLHDAFKNWGEINYDMVFGTDVEQFTDELIDVLTGGNEMADGFADAASERQERLSEAIEEVDKTFTVLTELDGQKLDYETDMLNEKIEDLKKGTWI